MDGSFRTKVGILALNSNDLPLLILFSSTKIIILLKQRTNKEVPHPILESTTLPNLFSVLYYIVGQI